MPTADKVRMPSTPGLKGRDWGLSERTQPEPTYQEPVIPTGTLERCSWPPSPSRGWPDPLTTHDELALPAHGGCCVAGNASVVAIVLEGDAGDLQGAHEFLALNGHTRA